jgi:hypothetical protein
MCTQASTQHNNDCIHAMSKLCVPSTQQFKLCVNHIKMLTFQQMVLACNIALRIDLWYFNIP